MEVFRHFGQCLSLSRIAWAPFLQPKVQSLSLNWRLVQTHVRKGIRRAGALYTTSYVKIICHVYKLAIISAGMFQRACCNNGRASAAATLIEKEAVRQVLIGPADNNF